MTLYEKQCLEYNGQFKPAGLENFVQLITGAFYFKNFTKYLPGLINIMAVVFLRPANFGKTQLLSCLEYISDVKQEALTDYNFSILTRYENIPSDKGSFYILSLKVNNMLLHEEDGLFSYFKSFYIVLIKMSIG